MGQLGTIRIVGERKEFVFLVHPQLEIVITMQRELIFPTSNPSLLVMEVMEEGL